ncbi:MAG: DUF1294 domain-containing protein [Desulfitobacteriaceae bacterium]|nr:DUF1294 domain-containing protein [Desulfitobacteriaceae bacterium]
MLKIFILIYFTWNVIVFFTIKIDKWRAHKGQWRISERNLLLKGLALGAVGLYAGMQVFRHKTSSLKFTIGVPLLIVINIIEVIFLIYAYNYSFPI